MFMSVDNTMQNFIVTELNEVEVAWLAKEINSTKRPCMTITGSALAIVLKSRKMKTELATAFAKCVSVICCRVSPKQKADVVQLVRTFTKGAVTLAIGDGANDVSMIVTAHVGVGLSGKEGAQAAATADVAIAEFRYLRRLMFVHGRESYRRMSLLILYNFYKNMLMVGPTALTAGVSRYSGSTIFHQGILQGYNLLYTNVTVVIFGLFDRAKANLDDLEFDPSGWGVVLYNNGIQCLWSLAAVSQAFMYNSMVFGLLAQGRDNNNSVELNDIYTTGDLRFLWVVAGANWTLAMYQKSWFWFSYLAYAFNMASAFFAIWFITKESWPERTTWNAFLGDDLPRIATASFVVMACHHLLNLFYIDMLPDVRHGLQHFCRAVLGCDQLCPDCFHRLARRLCPCLPCTREQEIDMSVSLSSIESSSSPLLRSNVVAKNSSIISDRGFAFASECQKERSQSLIPYDPSGKEAQQQQRRISVDSLEVLS